MSLTSMPVEERTLEAARPEFVPPLKSCSDSSSGSSSEAYIAELLAAFRQHPRFIVTSHARPDGDAIGSVLALAEVLDQLDCAADVLLADAAPAIYRTLPNLARIRFAGSNPIQIDGEDLANAAPAILLECDSISRTGLQGLEGRMLINIDHHASGRTFGEINWIDPKASAVAVMVYRIAVAAKVTITPSMATCLYTSILSDTGAFTYPNTTPESFAIAHELTKRGADPAAIARDLYLSSPLSKVRLLGRSLDRLRVENNIAWSWVTLADLERLQASPEDCEGIVGNLIGIEGVDAAFFLREQPDGQIRLSIRSKGAIDVARVAECFSGGGHLNASGCTLPGPLEEAARRVLIEVRSANLVKA